MKVKLLNPGLGAIILTDEVKEALEIIEKNVWRDATIKFYGTRNAMQKAGKNAPKGMQRFLNDILDNRFLEHGWDGKAGYYFKENTWLRITFRHQMSLGSDILDAVKVCKKEGMELAIILAASRKTLDVISPNDAAALVSYEKLEREVMSLKGALEIPLIIGELTPFTLASKEINETLFDERPRDTSIPNY